jgi:hypothetical protein
MLQRHSLHLMGGGDIIWLWELPPQYRLLLAEKRDCCHGETERCERTSRRLQTDPCQLQLGNRA